MKVHCLSEPAGSEIQPWRGMMGSDTGEFPGMLRHYYSNWAIRQRMNEFVGGSDPANVAGTDGWSAFSELSPVSGLPDYLEAGTEFNRAIFYTRLFTGMIAAGTGKLIELNCVSHREKGFCMVSECFSDLVPYREKLLERRRN